MFFSFSDASACKESKNPILRCGHREGKKCYHLIDATGQSLQLVTCSAFRFEALTAVGLVPLLSWMVEIQHGSETSSNAVVHMFDGVMLETCCRVA